MPYLKEQIDNLLERKPDVEKVHLIGHSHGGLTVIELMRQHPTYTTRRVATTTTVASPLGGSDYAALWLQRIRNTKAGWWQNLRRRLVKISVYLIDRVLELAPWGDEFKYNSLALSDELSRPCDLDFLNCHTDLPPVYTVSIIAGDDTGEPVRTGILKLTRRARRRFRKAQGWTHEACDGLVTAKSARGPEDPQQIIHLGTTIGSHLHTGGYLGPFNSWSKKPLEIYKRIAEKHDARQIKVKHIKTENSTH